MRLNEISKIPQQVSSGFDLEDFDVKSAEQLTTAENIPLVHFTGGPKDPNLHGYGLVVDEKIVSVLVGVWGTLNGKPALFVRRTHTLPEHQNRGLITALYQALYQKLKYVLVSDFEMSPETISVWKKLAQVLPVKVLDTSTGQMGEFGDGAFDENPNTRLVLESVVHSSVVIPESEGILQDYLNFTNPENVGRFI